MTQTNAPIAIVGMGCLFPKAADTKMFWGNIRRGVDAITPVPPTHWQPEDYFDANPKTPDMTYARKGGFLEPVAFSPLEYGVSPKDLDAIDTSQLLGLVAAKQALIDAGYGPDEAYAKDRVSVILGVTGTLELVIPLGARLGHPRWKKALKDAGIPQATADWVVQNIADSYVGWQENSFPGLLGNVVAGRISNRFDLGGTNCVVDAACASSLSAIHLATLELQAGRSDMVVSGGIDTFNDIFMYMCFSKTPALSPTGASKPFDKNGDGTILGEGLGVVVLKRLEDAQKAGDRIYAILRGIGSSSDGKGNAIYAPSSAGQIKCLNEAYKQAGVDPRTVELIEAHGTGTKVGDAAELTGLAEVFTSAGVPPQSVAIGSVKSQIGHTKAAAGAAGLIKAVLALHHKVLPPTIKIQEPLEILQKTGVPLYANTEARPWVQPSGHPRRAGVSAFGFGGSNFHAVLEEGSPQKKQISWEGRYSVALASSPTRDGLRAIVDKWVTTSESQQAFVAQESRQQFDRRLAYRLAVVVGPGQTLAAQARKVQEEFQKSGMTGTWHKADGLAFAHSTQAPGKLAFLFPGQGSQRVGMLRELACIFPKMLAALEAGNANFPTSSPRERLTDWIYPIPAFSSERKSQQEEELRRTDRAQAALAAVETGLIDLLADFGVQPTVTMGHSFGELVALHLAGVYDRATLHRLTATRGQLMAQLQDANPGGMLAVLSDKETIETVRQKHRLTASIANENSPKQFILAGTLPEITQAEAIFSQEKIACKRLNVGAAFHSPSVASASFPLRAAIGKESLNSPRIAVYANTDASVYPVEAEAIADKLAGQLAKSVRFIDSIRNMYTDGVTTFLEVGPGNVLTKLVESILPKDTTWQAIACDSSLGQREGLLDLAFVLCRLSVAGYAVDWSQWEESVGEPKKTVGFTVPICGANYTQPKKAAVNPAPALAIPTTPAATQPIPPQTVEVAKEAAKEVAKSLPHELHNQPTNRTNNRPVTAPAYPAATAGKNVQQPPLLQASPTRTPMNLSPSAVQLAQQSLAAFQKLQEETAQLHKKFLEHQEAAQRTLQSLLDQQLSLLQGGQATEGVAVSRYTPEPTPGEVVRPPVAPTVSPSPVSQSAPVTVVVPAPAPAPVPVAAPPVVAPAPVAVTPVASPLPTKPQPTPTHSVPAAVSPSLAEQTLLAVVAEKTGYPADILKLDMSLDGDLGIDSIKRVEILSALQDQLPDAPTVQPEHLGTLHTLGDIVQFLQSAQKSTALTSQSYTPASPPSPLPASPAKSSPAIQVPVTTTQTPASNGKASVDHVRDTLLGVVAEKTGYPSDILKLEMSLDADLGIDSIKRVEILSALQDQLPDAPTVQPEHLGTLHTLGDIVGFLSQGKDGGRREAARNSTANLTQSPVDVGAGNNLLPKSDSEVFHPPSKTSMEIRLPESRGQFSLAPASDDYAEAEPVEDEIARSQTQDPSLLDIPYFDLPAELMARPVGPNPPSTAMIKLPDSLRPKQPDDDIPEAEPVDDFFSHTQPAGEEKRPLSAGEILNRVETPLTGSDRISDSMVSLFPSNMGTVLPMEEILQAPSPGNGTGADDPNVDFAIPDEPTPSLLEGLPKFELSPTPLPQPSIFLNPPWPTQPSTGGAFPLSGVPSSDVGPSGPTAQPRTQPRPLAIPTQPAGGIASSHGGVDRSIVVKVPIDSNQQRPPIEVPKTCDIWLVAEPSSLTVKIAQQIDSLGYRPQFIDWNDSYFAYEPNNLGGLILVAPETKLPDNLVTRAFRWMRHAAKGLQDLAQYKPTVFATVTRLDGAFGLNGIDRARDPLAGAFAGLAKTAALEWSKVNCKAIDYDPAFLRNVVPLIVEEIFTAGPLEVGISGAGRCTLNILPTPVTPAGPLPVRSNDTLIVTGGGRGVTADCIVELCKQAKPKIFLLGRNPEPQAEPDWLQPLREEMPIKLALIARKPASVTPKEIGAEVKKILAAREIAETLRRIEQTGSVVAYRSVDVRDSQAVQEAVQECRRRFGPITGVVHGAGVISDKLIEEQTDEQFDLVFGTKALGFRNIWNAVQGEPLRTITLFSSSTGRFGRRGQVAYAAANEALNKMAQFIARQRPEVGVHAINWGPWAGGMVNPGLAKLFAAEGVGLIPLEAGARFFVAEYSSSDRAVETVVLALNSLLPTQNNESSVDVPVAPAVAEAVGNPSPENTQSANTGSRPSLFSFELPAGPPASQASMLIPSVSMADKPTSTPKLVLPQSASRPDIPPVNPADAKANSGSQSNLVLPPGSRPSLKLPSKPSLFVPGIGVEMTAAPTSQPEVVLPPTDPSVPASALPSSQPGADAVHEFSDGNQPTSFATTVSQVDYNAVPTTQIGEAYRVEAVQKTPVPDQLLEPTSRSKLTNISPSLRGLGTGGPVDLYLIFDHTLSVTDHRILRSHVINGRSVLPLALHMEWAAHTALYNNSNLTFHGFNDFRVTSGIQLDERVPQHLRFYAAESVVRDRLSHVHVELHGLREKRDAVHSRGEVVLTHELPPVDRAILPRNMTPYPFALDEIYGEKLFHGEELACIENVEGISSEAIMGTVRTAPPPGNWFSNPFRSEWITDPLMLDGCFQMMILWTLENYDAPCLPSHIGRYRQYVRTIPHGSVRVVIRITRGSSFSCKADVDFQDIDGTTLARIQDLECVVDATLKDKFRNNRLTSSGG